jgi:hypothetical protein
MILAARFSFRVAVAKVMVRAYEESRRVSRSSRGWPIAAGPLLGAHHSADETESPVPREKEKKKN